MSKKTALLSISLFSAMVAIAYQVGSQSNPVERSVQPVEITYRETAGNPDEEPLEVHKLFAVNSAGAQTNVTLPSSKHKTGQEARNIRIPADRKYVVIADALKVISTFPLTEKAANAAKIVTMTPACEEEGQHPLDQGAVLGYAVYRYAKEEERNGHRQRIQSWRSPQLDCRELRFVQERLAGDGKVAHRFERIATRITAGEPSAAIFLVPADYREVPPSEANVGLMERRLGRKLDEATLVRIRPGLDRMDKQYREAQALAGRDQ